MEVIQKYFPDLSPRQLEQFGSLDALYREWNERINVISRRDIDRLYEHHVLHSLAISRIVQFHKGARVLDVGTGGGFPGIPLAICFPDARFHLVDSIGKKIRVVNEVIAGLQLKNVTAEQRRIEPNSLQKGNTVESYDFSVSRAVAPLSEMIEWLNPYIRKGNSCSIPNGMIFLKGGDLEGEILETKKRVQVFSVADYFNEEFFREKKIVYFPV